MPRPRGERAASVDLHDDHDRKHKLDQVRIRVQAEAERIRTADDWARSLHAVALLRETFANSLLILAQRPDATLVKGYEEWRNTGRQVTSREPGIEILSRASGKAQSRIRTASQDSGPDREDWNWRHASRVAYVWDVSQTSGQRLTHRGPVPAALEDLRDALCWLARRLGYAVEHEHGAPADGVTWWNARRIRIPPGSNAAHAGWALAHQLGHLLLHNPGTHPPGVSTSGGSCLGVVKAEADAVAYIIGARHSADLTGSLAWPQTWAGTDPRARPGAIMLTAGERIAAATAQITQNLDGILPRQTSPGQAAAVTRTRPPTQDSQAAAAHPAPQPIAEARPGVLQALRQAGHFYTRQLPGSWVPGYLDSRGVSQAAITEWGISYAPAGWTALTEYLRGLGHTDRDIEAAGLARRSSRGTLIDHFRDRVMLPAYDEHGTLAGFIGRARPDAGPDVPKYLNSPQTVAYRKGELLFGWQQARTRLAAGAVPVIVEGPFDAIAVNLADPHRYAGLAPCGTALTKQQAALLGRTVGQGSQVIVAFDDDAAGRKAAVRAHGILSEVSSRLHAAALSGRDPAQILQEDGAHALAAVLLGQLQPLSAVVIDSAISPWEHRLEEPNGPLLATRSVAVVIAGLLSPSTTAAIRRVTAGRELVTVDDEMRPVDLPELVEIAGLLPIDVAYQMARVTEWLGIADYSDVLAEVANAVTRQVSPEHTGRDRASRLAATSFPQSPHTGSGKPERAANWPRKPGSQERRNRGHQAG